MRTHDVVVLQSRENGRNERFEFVLAAVDDKGILHQYGGCDEHIAQELVSMAQTGESIVTLLNRADAEEAQRAAAQRGDTPEMPRMEEWKPKTEPWSTKMRPGVLTIPPVITGKRIEADDAPPQ